MRALLRNVWLPTVIFLLVGVGCVAKAVVSNQDRRASEAFWDQAVSATGWVTDRMRGDVDAEDSLRRGRSGGGNDHDGAYRLSARFEVDGEPFFILRREVEQACYASGAVGGAIELWYLAADPSTARLDCEDRGTSPWQERVFAAVGLLMLAIGGLLLRQRLRARVAALT